MWATSVADWAKSASTTLIEAMLSTAAQTQVLIAIQSSVAHSTGIDEASANGLLAALKPIETMPDSIAESMVAEWQIHTNLTKKMSENPTQLIGVDAERSAYQRALDHISWWTFDPSDTMNAMAKGNLWSQDALRKTARGEAQPEYPAELSALQCAAGRDWALVCLPFLRNPAGRILSALATPAYGNYGVRVADLQNLAAATRLTIEARRRGLAGAALAQFVAAAPTEMHDVFTGNPFTHDPARNRVRVELRDRSTILGEKGPYELPL